MSLQQQLDAFKAESRRKSSAGKAALYDSSLEMLRASFAANQAMKIGDKVPNFVLPDIKGEPVQLSDLLLSGPAIVVFYRGGWCPYCNIQLRAYQAVLPEITALGAHLVAISPQRPEVSLSTMMSNGVTFTVLTDAGNSAARQFGLVWALPKDLRAALLSDGKDLPVINGDESWELPVPATYVIACDGRVTFAAIETDYRNRPEPNAIIAALAALSST